MSQLVAVGIAAVEVQLAYWRPNVDELSTLCMRTPRVGCFSSLSTVYSISSEIPYDRWIGRNADWQKH